MRVLLITSQFPTPINPERGVFTLQLVKRLKELCEVTVINPTPWFPKWRFLGHIKKYKEYSQVPLHYEIDGVEIYAPKYFLLPKISESVHGLCMSLGISRTVTQLHRQKKFDLVNSQWLYPDSVAASRVVDRIGIPHVATGLGCDVNRDLYDSNKSAKILEMLKECAGITTVSESLKAELVTNKVPAKKITVIPNGVDVSKFKIRDKQECRTRLLIEGDKVLAVYVGRLSEEKSVRTLLEAASVVIHGGQPLEVYLVGDGPLKNDLLILAESLGVKEYINFVGKVDHDEVSWWMGAGDLFCLPSIREGCPNVVLEALGSGRPILATNVGAIPDVVKDDSGILFEPGDVDGLVEAFTTAISKNWSETAISQSVKNLTWENAAKSYFSVYQQSMRLSS